ncbi:MAG: NAD-dependent epimerase/dehydratase family protein [Prosthecobacter sp.]
MPPTSQEELEERLSRPTPAVIEMMRSMPGDIIVLGAAGKMGPSLSRMAKRASDEAGTKRRVIAVSRFSASGSEAEFQQHGIETIAVDLLAANAVAYLPHAPNVIYMAGMKFGSTGQEPMTWAMNTFLPGVVCERFHRSRIAAFSTGNVYGLVPVERGGSSEEDTLNPAGEYAMSCVGRERIIQHFSLTRGTPVSIIRLNYACDLRYGVLVDIAQKVWNGQPVDVRMGYFNTIWQGDANALSLLSLGKAQSPAWTVNLTGTTTLAVREVAKRFGELFGKPVQIEGREAPDALLSNPYRSFVELGIPFIRDEELMEWVAAWVSRGGESLGKPTHFESRDGRF